MWRSDQIGPRRVLLHLRARPQGAALIQSGIWVLEAAVWDDVEGPGVGL